ncbi:MAG: ankyrin-3, partial [Rickettsiaceae bacterium]|nr:ankyrin-3 [Rickettsiaceae bacterium]
MKREIAQINDNPEIQIEEHAAKRLKSDLSELTFLDAPALEIKELIKKNDPELIAQKFDTVEKLLTKYNVKITDVYNLESINVLQVLAYIGSTEIIRKLLDRHLGTEVINSQTDGEVNATPLMFAAKKGHKEVVELLLDRGADIEYVVKSNNEGWNGVNLLHLAAANNRNEIIEHLHTKHQSKFKELVNKPKHDGFTPILLAVFNGHINSVEALIKSGADIEYVIKNNNQGWNDANLLHLAAFDDRKEIIEYLYKDHKDKFKKLVNKPKDDGYTPIFHAVIGGHKNSLEALIKSGADIEYVIKNNNQGWNGANILHLAAFHNKNEIIEHLHTNHASMLKELVNIPLHYYGLTPIFQAVIEGHKNSVEALIKSGADIEYVIKNNNQGWNDANLLHLAAFHDRKEIIEYLYKDHKDKFKKLVNKPSHGWCTPIFQAVIEGHKNSVEALIKSGADIDCKLPNGKTLSSFATERGHTEIVKLIETYKFAKSAAEKECDITTIQNAINTDKIQIDKFIDFLNFFIEKTSSTYAKALIVENNNSFKDVADLIWKHSLSKQYKELKTEKLCSLLGISSRLEVLKNSNATDEQSELLSELPEGLKEYIDNPEAL